MKNLRFSGKLIQGDLVENTMTFEINSEMALQAGKYIILTESDYNSLIAGASVEQKLLHINSLYDNSTPKPPCNTCENKKSHTKKIRCNKQFTDPLDKTERKLYYMQSCLFSL